MLCYVTCCVCCVFAMFHSVVMHCENTQKRKTQSGTLVSLCVFCFVLFCSVLSCYILFCGSRSTAMCPSTVQGVSGLNSFHSSVILTENRNKQSMKNNSGFHERMEQYLSTS